MHVDDLMGVTLRYQWKEERMRVRQVCEGLLRSRTMAKDKWDWGDALTGWDGGLT